VSARVRATVLELPDGRELAFTEYGDPAGIPVFGFHGTPGSRRQNAVLDQPAQRLGVRVIAPDRPGYGLSSFQPYRTLPDWARDVRELALHLELERFGVVGVSGGGPHAAVCGAVFGERLLGCCIVSGIGPIHERAALQGMMASNRLLGRVAQRAPALLRIPMGLQVALMRRWPERALRWLGSQIPEADRRLLERPEVRALFFEDFRRASATAARAAAQDFQVFARPWGFRLEEIEVPVHLWQGDLDRNVPAAHAELQAERIPKAILHRFPGEGHLLFVDRVDEILIAAMGRA
jgi:pimeloyl-ACP methyl ester carboxylesterase